jgi:hypothetical protein
MQQTSLFEMMPPPAPPPPEAWTAPPVDMLALAAMEAQGRSPFDGEGYDPDAAQGCAYETMIGLACDMAEILAMGRLHRLGASAFRTNRAWTEFLADRPTARPRMFQQVRDTIELIAEVWGRNGAAAFAREARRRAAICR